MKRFLLPGMLLIISSYCIQADELVYTPVNPWFGGNSNNGDWLLANAQAQNDHDDDDEERIELSPIDVFTSTLQRLVLNRLATNAVGQFFTDEGDFITGTYTVGDYEIDITDVDGVLTISTTDSTSGDSTQIVIDQSVL